MLHYKINKKIHLVYGKVRVNNLIQFNISIRNNILSPKIICLSLFCWCWLELDKSEWIVVIILFNQCDLYITFYSIFGLFKNKRDIFSRANYESYIEYYSTIRLYFISWAKLVVYNLSGHINLIWKK